MPYPISTRFRESHKDVPAGLREKRQVLGIVGAGLSTALDGSIAKVLTIMTRQSFLVYDYVREHGTYPDRPLPDKDYTSALANKCNKHIMESMKGKGQVVGQPKALLATCPWFSTYAKTLTGLDPHATAMVRPIFELVKKASELGTRDQDTKLRRYATGKQAKVVNSLASAVEKTSVIHESCPVAVQGGGNLHKENILFGNANIVCNHEKDRVDGVCASAPTVAMIKTQTQEGIADKEDFMTSHKATLGVIVYPTKNASRGSDRHVANAIYHSQKDDIEKMNKVLEQAQDPLFCEKVREDTLVRYEIANLRLVAESNMPVDIQSPFSCLGSYRVLRYNNSSTPQVAKCKFDGVGHYLRINAGRFTLCPRTVDEGREKETYYLQGRVYSYGKRDDMTKLEASLEIIYIRGKVKFHVNRIFNMNGRKFSPGIQPAHELQQKLSFSQVGAFRGCEPIEACLKECVCPIDGIVIKKDGNEWLIKTDRECDFPLDGFYHKDGLNYLAFNTYKYSATFSSGVRRLLPEGHGKSFQTVVPNNILLSDLGINQKHFQRDGYNLTVFNVELSKFDMRAGFPAKPRGGRCSCGARAELCCSHIEFCPYHPCTECEPTGNQTGCACDPHALVYAQCARGHMTCLSCFSECESHGPFKINAKQF